MLPAGVPVAGVSGQEAILSCAAGTLLTRQVVITHACSDDVMPRGIKGIVEGVALPIGYARRAADVAGRAIITE